MKTRRDLCQARKGLWYLISRVDEINPMTVKGGAKAQQFPYIITRVPSAVDDSVHLAIETAIEPTPTPLNPSPSTSWLD